MESYDWKMTSVMYTTCEARGEKYRILEQQCIKEKKVNLGTKRKGEGKTRGESLRNQREDISNTTAISHLG